MSETKHQPNEGSRLIGAARNFHLGAIAQGVPHWGPVGSLRSWSSLHCRHRLQILTAETTIIWKFHTIYLLILDQYYIYMYVSRWGAKRPISWLSRRPMTGATYATDYFEWQVSRVNMKDSFNIVIPVRQRNNEAAYSFSGVRVCVSVNNSRKTARQKLM